MAHIKSVRVDAISATMRGFYWNFKTFTTFTDDNGNKTYLINGEEVTKEQGNAEYLNMKNTNKEWTQSKAGKAYFKRQWASYYKLKKTGRYSEKDFYLHEADTFKQEVTEYDISYEELIEKLEKQIDGWVEYIDDYRQYESALDSNRKIQEKLDKLRTLIVQR